ncbi:MAG: P1 family peptidase [Pseudoxanthomonas sp.]
MKPLPSAQPSVALRRAPAVLLLAAMLATATATAEASEGVDAQAGLQPLTNAGGTPLRFDWPMLRIGTGEYAEGPTGVTVFHFGRKVLGAVDVRGGAPGTVNSDFLRLGYATPDLDSVVFAGGSWYGLEATTAVASALKDDGVRSGRWDNIALSVGAIIYDFGDRRLNEVYPDKKLAQAAYRAAQPGLFRNGAAGAGRFARSGDFFGCRAHSGQGGAFRQVGELKIAAFTVVNAFGVVARRDGTIAACYRDPAWPAQLSVDELVRGLPDSRQAGWNTPSGPKRNTTVSLVVVNQKMDPAELQRLAVQVHTSMARGIQPFASMGDGDVLYAVSTGEVEAPADMINPELGAIASEVMWDAILNSVPEQPALPRIAPQPPVAAQVLDSYAGDYRFSRAVGIRVSRRGDRLYAQANGERDAYAIGRAAPVELLPYRPGQFAVPGRYPLVLDFSAGDRLVVNPGPWQQIGTRQKAASP